jgi:thiamine-phosphate pyrophosphorylase
MAAGRLTLAELANRLNLACPEARARDLPPLIFLTDERRTPDPRAAIASLPPGSAVIVRHYDDPDRAALAGGLAEICRRRGLRFLIAADPALAIRLGADGVHMPEWFVRHGGARWSRRSSWLITAAAHGRRGLIAAAEAGADAALLSPVFPTLSHQCAPGLGVVRFAALARTSPLPVYALGGINATTARRLTSSGTAGLAAISAITAGPDPGL